MSSSGAEGFTTHLPSLARRRLPAGAAGVLLRKCLVSGLEVFFLFFSRVGSVLGWFFTVLGLFVFQSFLLFFKGSMGFLGVFYMFGEFNCGFVCKLVVMFVIVAYLKVILAFQWFSIGSLLQFFLPSMVFWRVLKCVKVLVIGSNALYVISYYY